MKRLLLLSAALMLAVSAHASSGANQLGSPNNIAFRIGIAYSFEDSTRSAGGTLFGIGMDYYLERSLFGPEGEAFVSIDWLNGTKSGSNVQMFPLMINQKWYGEPKNLDGTQRPYWFVGAGLVFLGNDDTEMTFGARGGLGMELSESLFVEGTVVIGGSGNGIRPNNIGAYVGYRF